MLSGRGYCNKYYIYRTSKGADPNRGQNGGSLFNLFECDKQKMWVPWPIEIFEEEEFSTSKFGADIRSENAEIKCLFYNILRCKMVMEWTRRCIRRHISVTLEHHVYDSVHCCWRRLVNGYESEKRNTENVSYSRRSYLCLNNVQKYQFLKHKIRCLFLEDLL